MEGQAVRSVAVAERARLAAWVSDLPAESGRPTVELVRVHDRVVRAALESETPLPARFGQSFASDAALGFALESHAAELEEALARVRGQVEMTVRILLSGAPAPGSASAAGLAATPLAAGAGRAYMAQLRERQQASAELKKEAEFLQARVARTVDGLARAEVSSRVMPGTNSFSLSHLVARGAIGEYRLAVDSLVKSDPALRLLVSGPWAPYSFARIAGE
jgi:hypothetical protein